MNKPLCPFCDFTDVVMEDPLCLARRDNFPVTDGHTLVTPKRHVASYFDCTKAEKSSLWAMVDTVQADLAATTGAKAFTVGINVGAAAGQTVFHAHIHVIPRYTGDTEDPRGGVRGVIPQKQRY